MSKTAQAEPTRRRPGPRRSDRQHTMSLRVTETWSDETRRFASAMGLDMADVIRKATTAAVRGLTLADLLKTEAEVAACKS